jgi:integrase
MTGLRISELIHIKIGDFFYENHHAEPQPTNHSRGNSTQYYTNRKENYASALAEKIMQKDKVDSHDLSFFHLPYAKLLCSILGKGGKQRLIFLSPRVQKTLAQYLSTFSSAYGVKALKKQAIKDQLGTQRNQKDQSQGTTNHKNQRGYDPLDVHQETEEIIEKRSEERAEEDVKSEVFKEKKREIKEWQDLDGHVRKNKKRINKKSSTKNMQDQPIQDQYLSQSIHNTQTKNQPIQNQYLSQSIHNTQTKNQPIQNQYLSQSIHNTQTKNQPIQNQYLFHNNSAQGFLSRQQVGRFLKELATALNFDCSIISPHLLRHSFANHLLHQGVDILALRNAMGHSSVNSTQRYLHSIDDDLVGLLRECHPLGQ